MPAKTYTKKILNKAYAALIIANIIWGAGGAIFKLSLENIPLFTLAFWRFFLGAMILLTIMGPKVGKAHQLLKTDLKTLIFYTLFGITFNILCFFEGLKLTDSINAPVIMTGAPILTAILAFIFLKEKISLSKIAGISLGSIGLLLIIIEPLLFKGLNKSIIGNLFLVLATMGAVGQTVIGRKILPRYNPFQFTFWAFLIGSLTFLPFAARDLWINPDLYFLMDIRGYTGIIFGAIFSSVLGYGLYAYGLSKIQASEAILFTYLDPIAGTIAGVLILNEIITWPFIAGSFFIVFGILIAEKRINYHPLKHLFINNML